MKAFVQRVELDTLWKCCAGVLAWYSRVWTDQRQAEPAARSVSVFMSRRCVCLCLTLWMPGRLTNTLSMSVRPFCECIPVGSTFVKLIVVCTVSVFGSLPPYVNVVNVVGKWSLPYGFVPTSYSKMGKNNCRANTKSRCEYVCPIW